MLFAQAILDQIENLGYVELRNQTVFRHMLADITPSRINTRGARWNPPEVGAIYTSFTRETALAEANYHLSLQTPRLRVKRTLYELSVTLRCVTRIPDTDALERVGVSREALSESDMIACQHFGGAVARLGRDGLIVPSARHEGGLNLVIYPTQPEIEAENFVIVRSEIVNETL